MNANIDIEKLWMEEKRGTVSLTINASGGLKLALRIWLGRILISCAARMLNMNVAITVDS